MGHDHPGMGGMQLPDLPPSTGRLLGIDLAAASPLAWVALVLLLLYAVGVQRLRRRGVGWSPARSLAWTAGCLSVFFVCASGLQSYGMALFSIHMIQHMVLSMVSPLLLLLGAPITLALRALPARRGASGRPRRLLVAGLHSRAVRVLSHPAFTVSLFIVSLYGVYFTPVFDALMGTTTGHTLMLTHFLAAGLLFFGPILAVDPWPRRSGPPARMLELLLPMPFHAFFGVIVMMASTVLLSTFADPPTSWGLDPLRDQNLAGGIAWAFGELPTLLVLAVVFAQWTRAEERAERTAERARGRALARGATDTDTDLDAYNAWLHHLAATSTAARTTKAQPL